MASKSFRTRLKESDTLQSSIEQEADGVGADLEEMLAPVLRDGETMPDMALAVRLLGRALGLRQDDLKASTARRKELTASPAGRRELREAIAELRGHVVLFREQIDGPIGPGTVQRVFGIAGRTPRNSHALELVVGQILARLRDPATKYPPTLPAIKVFPLEWIPILERSLQRLKDAHKGAAEEVHQGFGALDDKHVDQEAYDGYFKPLGWVVKGFYSMTGRAELFKKLRLGAGRSSAKKKRVAEPASDTDETSAT